MQQDEDRSNITYLEVALRNDTEKKTQFEQLKKYLDIYKECFELFLVYFNNKRPKCKRKRIVISSHRRLNRSRFRQSDSPNYSQIK